MNVEHYTGQLTEFLQAVSGSGEKEVEGPSTLGWKTGQIINCMLCVNQF